MISIVTSFDASITADELNSAVQLPNVRLVAAWPIGPIGLCQLREHMKFGQRYLSEKVALSFYARYRHQILSILTDFQVSERLH